MMTNDKIKRPTIRIPAYIDEQLTLYAKSREVTKNHVVIEILSAFVNANLGSKSGDSVVNERNKGLL